ncbi:hypothetical protein WSS_A16301, partial [Rhodococcus opacus M213]
TTTEILETMTGLGAAWPVKGVTVGEHEVRGGGESPIPVTRFGPFPVPTQEIRCAVAKRHNSDTLPGDRVRRPGS